MIEISPKEYEKVLNWDDGMLYCSMLVIDGKDDWRMPNKDELYHMSLKDVEDDNKWNGDTNSFYWTIDEYEDGKHAYYQNIGSGSRQGYYYKRGEMTIRPVRNL